MIDYGSDCIRQSITTLMPMMETFKKILQQHSCGGFIQVKLFKVKDLFGITLWRIARAYLEMLCIAQMIELF